MTYADVFETPIAHAIFKQKYSMDGKETWAETAFRVVEAVCAGLIPSEAKSEIYELIKARKFIPGGRYLYAAGRPAKFINNCYLFRAEDSREGWADALHKSTMALMTGGGIGFDYSAVRPEGSPISRTGGVSTGPLALMQMVNEAGRHIMQGGARRSAIWAGLHWTHADILKFIHLKDWSNNLCIMKDMDSSFSMPMELTNISVIYDGTISQDSERFAQIWKENCRQALITAEPGFSFNFKNPRESLKNACTEVVSEDDSDKCNLGTLWVNRFCDTTEFAHATNLATLFLLCGGIYSDVPTEKIREVGKRNNRIGLGLGGMHEWLLARGEDYEVTPEFHEWLKVYRDVSDQAARFWSDRLGVAEPKGKRALAPTGTIGLVAETTTGIEPLFCAAYKRRYFKEKKWHYQYVIDGSVKRLLDRGISLDLLERSDAYALSFEQRLRFQADVQDYVDMAISSTCNIAAWGSETNNESTLDRYSEILLKYAPRLRGFTVYPDGSRGAQPITKVPVSLAREQEGHVFIDEERQCTNGVCGV